MSSKHPVTTADSVVIVTGRHSPETTSDYSGSGEPALVHWRRRPYDETHAFPHCSSGGVVGVTNPRSFAAIDLPPTSPTKPIGDLVFDANPSATYQSLTDLPRSVDPVQYTATMGTRGKSGGTSSACNKCTAVLWFVVILALLVACAGVGLAAYNWASEGTSDSNSKMTELESRISASSAVIQQLSSMFEELQQNMTKSLETKNSEIKQLSLQLSRVNRSFAEYLESTATTAPVPSMKVNLSRNCEYELMDKCRILDTQLTPVEGAELDSYPNFSSCFTPSVTITMSDSSIQDVYCAVTNLREERNPVMATLRHDAETDSLSCYCFVTALEARRGIVECSMFLRRCPSVVEVN